jgi:TrmH family RNA methyltransferase
MNEPEALLLCSKSGSHFKQIRATLKVSGIRRTHTLLLGEKLITEWFESKNTVAKNRFQPVRWLRLQGQGISFVELELPLDTWELNEKLMKDISDTASPPSIALMLALADEHSGPIADRVIVPWGIQDPGNLGAILRSAVAFGFQEVLLGPGCVDPFSPKTLRGSMGALLTIPVRHLLRDHFDDGRWVALDAGDDAVPLECVELKAPLRLMAGSEGHGWKMADLPAGCIRARIPTIGVESLNVAVAVGIAGYEAIRRCKLRRGVSG